MKKIKLSNCEEFAIVDDCDFELLSLFTWRMQRSYNQKYAVRTGKKDENGKRHDIKMHRFIMSPPDGYEVDHIDHDGLNNTRKNLRVCKHIDNIHNTASRKSSASKYKGVSWHKGNKKWQANISINGKQISLGYTNVEEDAARLYDAAAKKHYGDFAVLNFE